MHISILSYTMGGSLLPSHKSRLTHPNISKINSQVLTARVSSWDYVHSLRFIGPDVLKFCSSDLGHDIDVKDVFLEMYKIISAFITYLELHKTIIMIIISPFSNVIANKFCLSHCRLTWGGPTTLKLCSLKLRCHFLIWW